MPHIDGNPRQPKILVVGAGLAGLAAAHTLSRAGVEVELWEAGSEPGGVVRSQRCGEFLFELGPNSVPQSALTLLALIDDLGLTSELVYSTPAARRRFLFLRGGLVPLPSNPIELLRTPVLSASGKLRLLSERLRRFDPPGPGETEPSFHALVAERFGLEAAERLAGAFVRGVYAGDARRLGARSAFPRIWDLLLKHGSILAGLAALARERQGSGSRPTRRARQSAQALVSLRGGFGQLVAALASSLGSRLVLGRAALRIEAMRATDPLGQQAYRLSASDGTEAEFAGVLLAVPAPAAARLLFRLAPETANELLQIQHAAVHTVQLGLARAPFTTATGDALPQGFGFLVPPGEVSDTAPRALGTLFPSQIFEARAPQGQVAVSMFYSAQTLAETGLAPAEVACEDLRRALKLPESPRPLVALDMAWPQGIAQAEVGHRERLERAQRALAREAPGISLAGGYVGGVSVEDTLRGGQQAVQRWLTREPAGGPRSG
jgi:oxygen-dependent protoporphyrinogen oxidase